MSVYAWANKLPNCTQITYEIALFCIKKMTKKMKYPILHYQYLSKKSYALGDELSM